MITLLPSSTGILPTLLDPAMALALLPHLDEILSSKWVPSHPSTPHHHHHLLLFVCSLQDFSQHSSSLLQVSPAKQATHLLHAHQSSPPSSDTQLHTTSPANPAKQRKGRDSRSLLVLAPRAAGGSYIETQVPMSEPHLTLHAPDAQQEPGEKLSWVKLCRQWSL